MSVFTHQNYTAVAAQTTNKRDRAKGLTRTNNDRLRAQQAPSTPLRRRDFLAPSLARLPLRLSALGVLRRNSLRGKLPGNVVLQEGKVLGGAELSQRNGYLAGYAPNKRTGKTIGCGNAKACCFRGRTTALRIFFTRGL